MDHGFKIGDEVESRLHTGRFRVVCTRRFAAVIESISSEAEFWVTYENIVPVQPPPPPPPLPQKVEVHLWMWSGLVEVNVASHDSGKECRGDDEATACTPSTIYPALEDIVEMTEAGYSVRKDGDRYYWYIPGFKSSCAPLLTPYDAWLAASNHFRKSKGTKDAH